MKSLLMVIAVLFFNNSFAQNISGGSEINLFYNSDSLKYDSKSIGFGGNLSLNDIDVFPVGQSVSNSNTKYFTTNYSRNYIPAKNNPYNHIVMNSLLLSYGEVQAKVSDNDETARIITFDFENGIGYKTNSLTLIPFTSYGTIFENYADNNFSGRKRKYGIIIKPFNFLGFSISHTNTILTSNEQISKTLPSGLIEGVGEYFVKYASTIVYPISELYPIYYWLTNVAYKLLVTSISRSNNNFPFNTDKHFEISSFDMNFRFELGI